MPDRRLVAIVTGLMLVMGGLGAGAEPTLQQLRTIDSLLTRNDTAGLLDYLLENPQVMAGDDELGRELRQFVSDASNGRLRVDYVSPTAPGQAAAVVGRSAGAAPGTY
ncbi:hypothetical protein SAMN05444722_3692 [Rhodovulum sp. ES.010]|uniref:hypothetical protein n=1 Tax=Rhodovulum sp. ES.010 TaxID=1882821 RepID=UPI00092A2142|nr:hypothetical protein [Rhodovulum sp. ES.010]SIO57163.1 hypothetical protein SAMN05444722_3692 [Rhodovulum sp. ES.010]